MSKFFKFSGTRTILTAGVFAFAMGATPAKADNVTDAMIGAYNSSGLLEQNRALLRAADEQVAIAVSRLRPIVQAALDIGRNYSRSATSSGGVVTSRGSTDSSVSLTMNWLLFDNGVSQLSKAAAQETVLATRQSLVDVEQAVLFAAVQAYVGVLSNQDIVALRRNNLRLLQEEQRAANDRFEVGEVTRTDVALAESRVAQARSNLINAEGDLQTAKAVYEEVVGRMPGAISVYPPLPGRPGSVTNARANALRTHPSLKAQQHTVKARELDAAGALRAMGPSLNLQVSGSHTETRNTSDSGRAASVGLQLSQQIYSGGRLAATRRAGLAQLDAAKGNLITIQRGIVQDVVSAFASLEAAEASLIASNEQVRAAQVAFDGIREEATLGSRTTLDVLEAEQDLLDAQTARLQARANQSIAAYQLLQAQGLLTADNLRLGVEQYDPELYYNAVKSAPAFVTKRGQDLDRVLKALKKN